MCIDVGGTILGQNGLYYVVSTARNGLIEALNSLIIQGYKPAQAGGGSAANGT
jgi:hypothetical protein